MALPEPITRLEQYWKAILDKIEGGGGSAPVLETLTAIENKTYTPDVGVDGFDEVTVAVPGVTGLTLLGIYDANNPPATAIISASSAAANGLKALVAVNQDGVKYPFYERIVDPQNRKVVFKRGSGDTIILDTLNGTIEGATSVTVYQATLVYPD